MKKKNAHSSRKIVKPIIKPSPKIVQPVKRQLPAIDLGLTVDLTFTFSQKFASRSSDIEIKGSKSFQTTDPSQYDKLFSHKVKECSKICDFSRNDVDLKAKATKTELLRHLISCFSIPAVQKVLTPDLIKQFYDMIAKNIFRDLPRIPIKSLIESHDTVLDTSWPHLSLVYETFQASFCSAHTNQISSSFIYQLLGNTQSADSRERNAVLESLKNLYQKCMSTRAHIRSALGKLFSDLIVNTELLTLYRVIVSSFNLPLKSDHINFFKAFLLPLHRVTSINDPIFWDTFKECLSDMITKSPPLLMMTANYLLSHWPYSNPQKEVAFLNELVFLFVKFCPENLKPLEITQQIGQEKLSARVSSNQQKKSNKTSTIKIETIINMPVIINCFYRRIGKCINSSSSEVAQAALDSLITPELFEATFGNSGPKSLYEGVIDGLMCACKSHWDENIRETAIETIKLIRELDPELFQKTVVELSQKNSTEANNFKETWSFITNCFKQIDPKSPNSPSHFGSSSYKKHKSPIMSPNQKDDDLIRRSH